VGAAAAHNAPVDGAPPLETDGLGRDFGELAALSDFTLTVAPGECVALLGANGSGKSTAVRTIAGQLEPTHGTVSVCGHDPHHEPDAENARELLALVPDNPLLYPDLTVREHLQLVATVHGVKGPDVEDLIDELLERLAIADRQDFQPAQLSRGMRQKTQLACALIRPAGLLLLDEPVVGLDPLSQRLLRDILEEAKEAGIGVVLTTHQLAFADGLADRALLLDEGRVTASGSFAEVAHHASQLGWFGE
jgi:ABC-2 type transport system ATP-binding protein